MMVANGRLEPPSDRGMHAVPVPSGAGVAIVSTTLLLWPLWRTPAVSDDIVLALTLTAVALVSWIDDRRGLSPALRLATHAAAVTLLLVWLGPEQRILPGLPPGIERALLGLAWLWFINLFNFMDGIDGLAGAEAVAVAVGYALVVTAASGGSTWTQLALIVAAAAAGYLFWNWHPAKVFMGDTGSITLGLLLGWLMIDLAFRGLWAAGVILPLYFVADATITLARRLARGESPWLPHRQHAYQRAVLAGTLPSVVVLRATAANAALVVLALISIPYPVFAITVSAGIVAVLLGHLERSAKQRPT
jgi:UDP-N-acetylmuramyl pentapeptide phosphotransferase/UDP-N-acetylglucosamine-1-phosphate transferase